MSKKMTQEEFLKDVKDHAIEVIKDDGVYRHIRFKKDGTFILHFDLITWPGYLCYTGDMGTYVFTRLKDMFEFFRTKPKENDELHIDLGYWSEKLTAVDGNRHHGSAIEFSKAEFLRVINEYRTRWLKERYLNKEERKDLWDAVENEVLSYIDEDENILLIKANRFHHTINNKHYCFDDLWDYDLKEYTYHFQWCCYAIAWGIQKYDMTMQSKNSEEVAA